MHPCILRSLGCNKNCHSPPTVRAAQRQLFAIFAVVISVCLVLEFLWPLPVRLREPAPVFPRVYLTSECGYERRLGNVMFTYAATLGIAQRHNMTPVIERRTLLTQVFKNIDALLSNDMQNTMFGSVKEYHEYGRRGSAYDRGTERLFKTFNKTNVHLRGYFQSWRYFDHIVDVVRRNFVFKEDIALAADEFLSSVVPPKWHDVEFVRIGIHVRRGDMILPYYRDYGYTVPPADYFARAMQFFIQRFPRIQFIVCSDDVAWCRANILPFARSLGENVNVAISKGTQFEDLAILSRCNHVIMSVGSFGWWAAWLANGTTVYYENWPRYGSMLEYNVDKRDYFPSHWIKMS